MTAEERAAIEPVHLVQERLCHFKAKPCRACGRPESAHRKGIGIPGECDGLQRQRGCERCGRNKGDLAHFGAPKSYNAIGGGRGTGAAAMVGANLKQTWQRIFTELLEASKLPKGLEAVWVEGEITFPDRREDRDQGNFRVVIEKALGDALQEGGWIERDDWTRYEFAGLTMRIDPGRSATSVTIFPRKRTDPNNQERLELL